MGTKKWSTAWTKTFTKIAQDIANRRAMAQYWDELATLEALKDEARRRREEQLREVRYSPPSAS